LQAAKGIAAARNMTAGAAISELLRAALTSGGTLSERVVMNGLRVVAPTGNVVTREMVREHRESSV
jgi:UDP-3-O-acyl-N-acetylglucosamine deacetylase